MASFTYITKLDLSSGMMTTLLVLILFLTLVFYLYFTYYKHSKKFMKFANEIPGPKCYPVIGSAYVFGTDPSVCLKNVSDHVKYGRVSGYWIGPLFYVGMCRPEDLEVVLGHKNLLTKSIANDMMKPVMGDGLVTVSGEKWKKHRKILQPTFHSQILRDYVEVFIKKSKILNDLLESQIDKQNFDIIPFTNNYTYDVLCETLMAVKSNEQMSGKEAPFISSIQILTSILINRFFRPWMYVDSIFRKTSVGKTFYYHAGLTRGYTKQIMLRKLKAKETTEDVPVAHTNYKGKMKRKSFLDFVLEVNKGDFSEMDKIDECNTMMAAGYDTTSVSLGFLCTILSKRFDIQEKIVEEIKEVIGSLDEITFTYDDVKQLTYLDQVVKETFRVLPSVPYVARKITEDVKLHSGYTLPAGCSVIIAFMHLHREPYLYPNPNVFDPDNFLPQRVAARHPFSYCPFSAGPRNCIGQQYAMLQLKSFVVCLLRRFWLTPTDTKLELVARITMNSKNGVHIGLKKRTAERPHVPDYENLSKQVKTDIEFFNIYFKESYL